MGLSLLVLYVIPKVNWEGPGLYMRVRDLLASDLSRSEPFSRVTYQYSHQVCWWMRASWICVNYAAATACWLVRTHQCHPPSRHDLLKVRDGSISFLILINASRTIGPQVFISTSYVCTLGLSPGFSGSWNVHGVNITWLHRQWHINQYYITYNIVTVWNSNVLYITVYYDSFLYLQPYRVCAGLYYAIGWCAPCTLIRCFSSFFLQECILRFYSMHYSTYKRGNPSLDLWSMHANHLSEDCVIVNFQHQGGQCLFATASHTMKWCFWLAHASLSGKKKGTQRTVATVSN